MTYDSKVNGQNIRAIDRFEVCVALTFDHKVISAILNLHLNQDIISKYCAKYRQTSSMHERRVFIVSSVTDIKNI